MAARTARFLLSLGNVFFSLILGALTLATFWYYMPDLTLSIFRYAGQAREWIVSQGLSARYEILVRAILDDRQVVYMGFVIFARIIVGLLFALGYFLSGRMRTENNAPAVTKA